MSAQENTPSPMTTDGTTPMDQLINQLASLVTAISNQSTKSSNPTPTPTPKINVKLPTYSGNPGENIWMWALQTKSIFMSQGITDEFTRICYAVTALTDGAQHWFQNQCTANQGKCPWSTWDEFVQAIQKAFQPPNYQQYLRDRLDRTKQTGSVQEYATRFRNVLGQVENMAEEDKIRNFLRGLKPSTRAEVKYRAPSTFEEAWQWAINYDTAHYGDEMDRPRKPKSGHRRAPRNNESTPMELDSMEKRESRKTKTCHQCGKPGHYARNCRNKGKRKDVSLESNAMINQVKETGPTNETNPTEVVKRQELIHITDNKERLLWFNAMINGHKAWILVDSGASGNFISEGFVEKHKLAMKDAQPFEVEFADGRKKQVTKAVNVEELKIGITA